MPKIVCVGSMNMDIAAYGAALPRPGETVFGTSVVSSPGGKGLNQAVAARRLGAEVAMVGCLGQDATGDAILKFLKSESIDVNSVCRIEGAPSGSALILVDQNSENAIMVIPGANMKWPADLIAGIALASRDIVVSQFEVPDSVIIQTFTMARAIGAMTVLNAAPARPTPELLLGLTDVLIVNETELAATSGGSFDAHDLEAIIAAASEITLRGVAVVVTLGRQGVVVVQQNAVTCLAGHAVEAVDTAGAGDCFIGALCASLLRGASLDDAAAFANRAASLSVTRKGTAIAMPYAREL